MNASLPNTMWISTVLAVYSVSVVLSFSLALETPCREKRPGETCLFDEECQGENTRCKKGKCVCPIGQEQFALDDKTLICRPAPDRLGAECQSECKPPLLCRSGKCECWQGQVDSQGNCRVSCGPGKQLIGQDCVAVSQLNGRCTKDAECIAPFSICNGGRCVCASGTRPESRYGCVAVCPSGFPARESCRRLFQNDEDVLQHHSQMDSCPQGYQCMTYGKPLIGHCCPVYCPHGTADLRRSCDPGAPLERKCRQLTHYCHFQTGPGWKVAQCCPRPCREPTPLYLGGRCLSLAHRDDPCSFDIQCEGGQTMQCNPSTGRCQCKLGYTPVTDRFPTCKQPCPFSTTDVLGDCLPKARLAQKCVRSEQCPVSSHCAYGKCQCNCGYKQETVLNSCINPDDPLNLNKLIDSVGRFFGSASNSLRTPGRLSNPFGK